MGDKRPTHPNSSYLANYLVATATNASSEIKPTHSISY